MEIERTTPLKVARLCGIVAVFVPATLLLLLIVHLAPPLDGTSELYFPKDLKQLREIADTLQDYKSAHFSYTMMLYSYAYIYKQTFCIPGSFFLNLLSGALFGLVRGVFLVCFLAAVGSSCCFMLSSVFAGSLVERFLSRRIISLRETLARHRRHRFLFLLSARVFPFTPHGLLNICSPFLGIPLTTHFGAMFLGLIPSSIVCVRAGLILSEIRSFRDVFDVATLLELFFLACLILAAALITRRRRNAEVLPHDATE